MASSHPSEEFLLGYALGTLDEPTSLVVAAHLETCEQCRQVVACAEAAGGELFEATVPLQSADDDAGLAKVLAVLDSEPVEDSIFVERVVGEMVSPTPPGADVLSEAGVPSALRPYLSAGQAGAWRWLGPGVRYLDLVADNNGARAGLIHVRAGASAFAHDHNGEEITLVLKGAYTADGQRYAVGDVECAEPGHVHRPTADGSEDCLCLVATTGGVLPTDPFLRGLSRLAAPLIGS